MQLQGIREPTASGLKDFVKIQRDQGTDGAPPALKPKVHRRLGLDDEAKEMYPGDWESPWPDVRIVPQPR